jgi:serine phosphatase RsbU (regulator of sigma subunit)/ligand-binding sensor domain-containing protein
MKQVFLLIVFLLPILVNSQINKYGVPEVTNYVSTQYNASEQNWVAVQDNRGVMYFGNTNGVLEFDGKNWRKIEINNGSIIRSLLIDKNGVIYAGGVGEFGYLRPGNNGMLEYEILSNQIDSANSKFTNVWKIHETEDGIFFCSQSDIFLYKNLELKKIIDQTQYSFMTFLVEDKFYIGNYGQGLMYFDGDSMILAPGGEAFERINIFTIIPTNEGRFLLGTTNGIYSYDPISGYVKENVIPNQINTYFKENGLYGGLRLIDNNLAFNTAYGGAYILNEKGKPIIKFDKSNGINDIQVSSIYQKPESIMNEEPIWLTFLNGISKVNTNSPVRYFDEKHGLKGNVYSIIRYNKVLYVATSAGVFYLQFDENSLPVFVQIPDIKSAWDFHLFKYNSEEILLVGTEIGLYHIIDRNNVVSVEDDVINLEPKGTQYIVYKLMSSQTRPGELFIGGNAGLTVIKYNSESKKWKQTHEIDEIRNIRSIAVDHKKLWIATLNAGIYTVDFSNSDNGIQFYDTTSGLPVIHSTSVHNYNNKIVVTTQKGIYRFNNKTNRFVPDSSFNERYNNPELIISDFDSDAEGNAWFRVAENNLFKIERLIKKEDGSFSLEDKPYKVFPKIQTEKIYFDDDDIIWFGISNKLYSYNLNYEKNYEKKYNTLIRKVTIGRDSIIFNGTNYSINKNGEKMVALEQPDELKYVLDYKYNGLIFQFVAPFFEKEEDLVYSSYLKGFKDPWSHWSDRTERVYTNLDRGQYTFMVKAKNVYGVESEVAQFHFTILPPWYKTIVAFIGYIVLAIIIVYIIVKIYTRRLELEKIRLEGIVAERTAEVVKQKDEIELQRDEIEEQKEHIMDSIFYARRIQQAVVPSPERAEEVLPEHFLLWLPHSIVSGDFWWMTEKDNKIIVVAADCTGHGVPGAFMSMLGVSFLNEIVNKMEGVQANEILNQLRTSVKSTLKQTGKEGEAKDGMDLALVVIDMDKKQLQYAGAYNPIFIYRGNEFIEIKADRNPIGIYIKEKDSFTNNIFDYQSGDTFYIFSDGYIDQFGGEKNQKFKTKNFKALLADIQKEPMKKQREILDETMLKWRGDTDQIDDIIVLGVRMP